MCCARVCRMSALFRGPLAQVQRKAVAKRVRLSPRSSLLVVPLLIGHSPVTLLLCTVASLPHRHSWYGGGRQISYVINRATARPAPKPLISDW